MAGTETAQLRPKSGIHKQSFLHCLDMRLLLTILLTCKIGFIAAESVTPFKLLDKGLKEEDVGLTALINFPLQIIFGYYAAAWSKPPRRLNPWIWSFYGRLGMGIVSMALVYGFPQTATQTYFGWIILASVVSSFLGYEPLMGIFYIQRSI
jgi:hypothetical protein